MKSILIPGNIISHAEMTIQEGFMLQRGMNFRVKGTNTVILMSLRKGAPYADRVEEDGKILIYEGHDEPKNVSVIPKAVDQPIYTPSGKLTANGKFYEAAINYQDGLQPPELVTVYEKIKDGIWVFNGVFELIDAYIIEEGGRKVFKFKLRITDETVDKQERLDKDIQVLDHNRIIPTSVKLQVWKRDGGKCVTCGSINNLHFDHILPFAKGGTSLKAENIQLLCARHNLAKRDRIE